MDDYAPKAAESKTASKYVVNLLNASKCIRKYSNFTCIPREGTEFEQEDTYLEQEETYCWNTIKTIWLPTYIFTFYAAQHSHIPYSDIDTSDKLGSLMRITNVTYVGCYCGTQWMTSQNRVYARVRYPIYTFECFITNC